MLLLDPFLRLIVTNPIPQRIAPDHFVGQARASTGEIIYLHMQLITAENQPYWQQYIKASIDMGYSARCAGLFPQIIRHTRKMKHQNSTQYTCGSFFSYNKSFFKSATGYTWQEFDAFVNALGQKGFIDTYKADVLKLNTVGSHHIEPYHDGHRYIIYATKTEHFDIQATKLSKNPFQILPFKSYVEQYQNLLMCVTGDFNHMQYYENRGIFRNPYSVIENKHKNISMLLHAFSAAVAKHFFSQRILRIRPVSFMQQIICKTLESEDLTITGSSSAIPA